MLEVLCVMYKVSDCNYMDTFSIDMFLSLVLFVS